MSKSMRSAAYREEIKKAALRRPTEEAYWESEAGRASFGVLHVDRENCRQGATGNVACVAWGLSSLAEASALAAVANFIQSKSHPKVAETSGYVGVPRPPCVLRHADKTKEMYISPDFPLCTNPTWIDEQEMLVLDVFIAAGAVLAKEARKMLGGALVQPIQVAYGKTYKNAEIVKWAKEAAAYAVLRAEHVIINTNSALPDCPLPKGMWAKIKDTTTFHLAPLRQHWSDVVRCKRVLKMLLGKVRAVYASLPLEFTDGRIVLVNPANEKEVTEATWELTNRRSSLPVFPADVEPALSYDSDEEDEGLADARANGEDKGHVLEGSDDDDDDDDGDDEAAGDPMEGVEEEEEEVVIVKPVYKKRATTRVEEIKNPADEDSNPFTD